MKLVHGSKWLLGFLVLTGCNSWRESAPDPEIAAEVQKTPAIDNHAHPVRNILQGPPDREFDALPVDNMEPASDPVNLRANAPAAAEAARRLFGNIDRKPQIQRQT